MLRLLLALALIAPVARAAEVAIPDGDITLQAKFFAPAQPTAAPVVALHGCGGPFPTRDHQWRDLLVHWGHPVLFPNSFASRGLGSQCNVRDRTVRPARERRADAVAAVQYLLTQASNPAGVFVLGWSNGASTTLWAAEQGTMPPGAVRAFVAFYPGCREILDQPAWQPSAPTLILIGELDDWTPAQPCRDLAARFPDRITLVTYPGAYHDFDVPGRAVTVSQGRAYSASGSGTVHAGTNEPAREDAITRVKAWLEAH